MRHPSDLELQMRGYRLTTAEIIYRLPDHLDLLQTFLWQHLDLEPDFPNLMHFLDFWEKNIDGPLYHVKISSADLITPGEVSTVDFEICYEKH